MDSSRPLCRICWDDATVEELISPCSGCRGSSCHVHFGCVVAAYQSRQVWWDLACPTCKQVYEGLAAVRLGRMGLERTEELYGEGSVEVAHMLTNLGNAYANIGDARTMKELLERALGIFQTAYGKNHRKVSIALANLGNAYGELGDARRKKELLQRALAIDGRGDEQDRHVVAVTLTNLANACGDLGDTKQMIVLLERALGMFQRCGSKREVAIAMTNLATAYGSEDARRMKQMLEQSLAILEREYGAAHPKVAIALTNVVCADVALGLHQEARDTAEKALCMARAALPFPSAVASEIALTLAAARHVMGDADATPCWRQGVDELRSALGEQDALSKLASVARSICIFWRGVERDVNGWLQLELAGCEEGARPVAGSNAGARKRMRLNGKQRPPASSEEEGSAAQPVRGAAPGGLQPGRRRPEAAPRSRSSARQSRGGRAAW